MVWRVRQVVVHCRCWETKRKPQQIAEAVIHTQIFMFILSHAIPPRSSLQLHTAPRFHSPLSPPLLSSHPMPSPAIASYPFTSLFSHSTCCNAKAMNWNTVSQRALQGAPSLGVPWVRRKASHFWGSCTGSSTFTNTRGWVLSTRSLEHVHGVFRGPLNRKPNGKALGFVQTN